MRKKRVDIVAVILKVQLVITNRETHFCGLKIYTNFLEESYKVGIGAIIEYNKSCIDSTCFTVMLNFRCAGVAANIVCRLIEGDIIFFFRQVISADKT